MSKRTTITVPFYSNGRIAGYDTIPKPPKPPKVVTKEDLIICKENINTFYENLQYYNNEPEPKTIDKTLRHFYVNIPLDDIEIISNNSTYALSNVSENKLKLCENHFKNKLLHINLRSSKTNASDNDNILNDCTQLLFKLMVQIRLKDFNNKQQFTPSDDYILCVPHLRLLQKMYFSILFNRYLSRIFLIKTHHLAFASYQYIKKHFHFECTNDIMFNNLWLGFENLKSEKFSENFYLLSYSNKLRLYKFIIYLKTYYTIVNKKGQMFNDEGTLINKEFNGWLSVFYHRENKKYFSKYFGKNADFNEFLASKKIIDPYTIDENPLF